MVEVFAVFGQWKMLEHMGWDFVVSTRRGGRVYFIEDSIKYEDFLRMICEDYNMVEKMNDVELAYMLPKHILEKMARDTPPVFLSSDRQLTNFITLSRREVIRICVSQRKNHDALAAVECDDDRTFHVPPKERVNKGNGSVDFVAVMEEAINPLQMVRSATATVKVGAIFRDKAELTGHLRKVALTQRFDFNIAKSRPKLWVAKCFVPGCSWRIRAKLISDANAEFVVSKFNDLHTCSAVHRYSRQRQSNAHTIGTIYVAEFSGGSNLKGVQARHIMDIMKSVYGLEVTYKKAHRALLYARQLVRGTYESGYSRLPSYLYKIEKANPGSITKLECDAEGRFKYVFIALSACIKGFQFLRRVVVVDGAHLSGKFRGTMLVAAGQDGNGNIFPIAYAVVNTEDDASWEWFFTQLRRVIVDDKNLAIISDRHPSIKTAIEKVYPAADRGICLHHLNENLKKKFKKNPMIEYARRAAYACRGAEFTKLFEVIRRQESQIARYLEESDPRLWARSQFPGDRYDVMTSNICESINSALKEDRSFPVSYFVDAVRNLLTKWFSERRTAATNLKTPLTEKAELILHLKHSKTGELTAHHIDSNSSHVRGGEFDCVVDLEKV